MLAQTVIWFLALIGLIAIGIVVVGLLTLLASLAAISNKRRNVVGKGMREKK